MVTAPAAVDKAYGPLDVYNLAKNKNIDSSIFNADSWCITALAIWAQQTFNLASPPQPAEILNPSPPLPANEPSGEDVCTMSSTSTLQMSSPKAPQLSQLEAHTSLTLLSGKSKT